MRIRSITCFCSPLSQEFLNSLDLLARLANAFRTRCISSGWEVQTARLATTPIWQFTEGKNEVARIKEMEKVSKAAGFDYLSIGPARLSDLQTYERIPEILGATDSVFCSAFLTHPHTGVNRNAVRACARVIHSSAQVSPDGFANLRFCAMSHVRPFTPFFPAAYSYGPEPAFAVAVECADTAVSAFAGAADIQEGRARLLESLNGAGAELSADAISISREFGVAFKGIDFSLAPFPEDWCSIGKALESMGVAQIGYMGSLSSAAILADALERGTWPRTGFNGLMLPVLEDSVLAERSASGHFSIKDLLMISAVCGTGLDTVPLPGDTSGEKIEALLLDIASLSQRLGKPLTARLMPVPGLKSGDLTRFDFNFFRNSRVMDFPAGEMGALFQNSAHVDIRARRRVA
jgi:hypothetical protein